jgi:DNA-directed RNA polymerase subunit D
MAKNISTTQNGDEFVISFKDTHNTIVNSVRRIILDEVPTFAIEDVEVVKNESPLYSETIAHRLGLIPLKTDLKSYNFKETCNCGGVGCSLCEVKLTLKQEEEGYVFSELIKSDDPQIVPADTRIPVTKLFPGKVLELNLVAVLGRGKEHAKWAPAHTYLREGKDKEVMLVIESFGQLESKEIYNTAVDILLSKIDELESNL